MDNFKYINIRTGAVIYSPCVLNGGDWIPFEESVSASDTELENSKTESDKTENLPDTEQRESIIQLEKALSEFTVADLKELAFQYGIDLDGANKKAEITKVLEESGRFK